MPISPNTNFMEPFLSKQQYGLRKEYSTQHCLLVMLEKWKAAVDQGTCFGALLTDLSKAFECLPYDLPLSKLHVCELINDLRLIQSYLSNRKQRKKVHVFYSLWGKIMFGIPGGSVLSPLIFNIFLCDLFSIMIPILQVMLTTMDLCYKKRH